MPELDDAAHERIVALSEEGNRLAEVEQWDEAIAKFKEALTLVPEPIDIWEASMWLLVAIGDCAFLSGQFERAAGALRKAMRCPGAKENPFVHLRLGQAYFQIGDMKRAENELAGAYMLAGSEIFDGQDPKYFAHLKTVLRPPVKGGW